MAYIIWPLIGIVVAMVIGAGSRRRAFHPNANASLLAGAFGGLIGGIIGDGLPQAHAGPVTLWSIPAAIGGALLFCWAVHERASDAEP